MPRAGPSSKRFDQIVNLARTQLKRRLIASGKSWKAGNPQRTQAHLRPPPHSSVNFFAFYNGTKIWAESDRAYGSRIFSLCVDCVYSILLSFLIASRSLREWLENKTLDKLLLFS